MLAKPHFFGTANFSSRGEIIGVDAVAMSRPLPGET